MPRAPNAIRDELRATARQRVVDGVVATLICWSWRQHRQHRREPLSPILLPLLRGGIALRAPESNRAEALVLHDCGLVDASVLVERRVRKRSALAADVDSAVLLLEDAHALAREGSVSGPATR